MYSSPWLSLRTIVERTKKRRQTKLINREKPGVRSGDLIMNIRWECILLSIFRGLFRYFQDGTRAFPHRSSAFAGAAEWKARTGRAKLQRHSFPRALPRNSVLMQPEFCAPARNEHASFNFTNAPGRLRSCRKSRRPHDSAGFNYAACEGFRVIK